MSDLSTTFGGKAVAQAKLILSSTSGLVTLLAASCGLNYSKTASSAGSDIAGQVFGQHAAMGSEGEAVVKDAFIANIVANMTVPELGEIKSFLMLQISKLYKSPSNEISTFAIESQTASAKLSAYVLLTFSVLQLHLMSADNIVSIYSDNSDYDYAMRFAPDSGIGAMHDFYVTNASQYNTMQRLNSEKSRLKIPFLQMGECLHGVGSFKQSMFPQSIGLAASFDTDLVYRVGRAIGSEARSIGIQACFSPVLDLGLEPRWGRGSFYDLKWAHIC